MAATLTSVWGLGVILGVAVLLIGTIALGLAGRARRRRRQRNQAMERGQQLAEQAFVPVYPPRSAQQSAQQPAPRWEPQPEPQPASEPRSTILDEPDPSHEPTAHRSVSTVPAAYADPAPDVSTSAYAGESLGSDPRPVDSTTGTPATTAGPVEPTEERVTVRVQNPAEEPLDLAVLTLAELDGTQIAGVEFGCDGEYDLGPLPAGSYVLVVRCPDYRPYAEVIELGDGLSSCTRVELSSDSGLAGVVRRKDGEPVSSATVTLKDGHGVVMTARTGPDGDYRVTGVRPGAYTLLVTARVCRPVELAVDVPERGLSRQDVELIGGAHVQGTVRVDQGRKVLPGTRILLLGDRGEVLATTDADEQGRYRFSEVNAGEYTVCATPPSPAVSTVRIDGGLVHELDLELRQTS